MDGTFGLGGLHVRFRVEMVTKDVLESVTNLYLLTVVGNVTGVQATVKCASTNTVRVYFNCLNSFSNNYEQHIMRTLCLALDTKNTRALHIH